MEEILGEISKEFLTEIPGEMLASDSLKKKKPGKILGIIRAICLGLFFRGALGRVVAEIPD